MDEEKNNTTSVTSLIFILIFTIAMTLFFVLALMVSIEKEFGGYKLSGYKDIKCYDKYSHEIKNQVCKEEVYCSEWGFLYNDCEN